MSANYYEILGVPSTANEKEIKSAFKKLAVLHHPDKNPEHHDAEERFKEANHAYQVLSDPQRRAQYDLQLLYSSSFTFPEESTSYSEAPDYDTDYASAPRTGYNTYTREQQQKDEKQAILWVGIIAVAVIVVSVIGFKVMEYWKEKELLARQMEKMELLGQAIQYYNQKDYRQALAELKSIMGNRPNDREVMDMHKKVLNELSLVADSSFRVKDYQKTLDLLQINREFGNPKKFINPYLESVCLRETGQFEDAISSLKDILNEKPEDIRTLSELGKTYLKYMKEAENALIYYNQAASIIINYYRDTYGDAYAMLVNPADVSEVHFEIFVERAQSNLLLQNYDQVKKDTSWAIFLRPNHPLAYLLQGDASFGMGKKQDACRLWQMASERKSVEAFQKVQETCR